MVSTSATPWLRVTPPDSIASRRFVRIRYAASLLDDPVRPLIRFRTVSREQIEIMNGAVCGCAEWIGRVPDGTLEVSISPVDRPGPFGFRIERIEGLSRAGLLLRAAIRHPVNTVIGIGAWIIRAREVARERILKSVCHRSLRDYDQWVQENSRPAEPEGLDALPSLPFWESRKLNLFVDLSTADVEGFTATLQSVQAQIYPDWTLNVVVARERLSDALPAAILIDSRICVIDAQSDVAAFTGEGLCAQIASGDILLPYALAAIATAATRDRDADAIYGDEDAQGKNGTLQNPVLRPDWSPIRQEFAPYLGPLTFVRAEWLLAACSTSADLATPRSYARAIAAASNVQHVRRVLYRRVRNADIAPAPVRPRSFARDKWPKTTIVIPTRDRADLLSKCVHSLACATDYEDFDIILVDNGSTEPQALTLLDELRAKARYKVLRRPERFNYSKLCNDAAAESDAPVLIFLNNDTVALDAGWLKALVDLAVRPDVGAVGAMLLYPAGPFRNRIQHAGVALGPFGIASHTYSKSARNEPGYRQALLSPHEVSAVTGACLAVERTKFNAIGGFDAENLPIDLNDIDLCLRLAERGWRSIWTPDAVLYHQESASRGKTLDSATLYHREQSYFKRRWTHAIRDDRYFHPAFSLLSDKIRLS